MTRCQLAPRQTVANPLGQFQQAQRVGNMRAALADDLGHLVLAIGELLDQLLVTQRLFQGIEIGALDILDDRKFQSLAVVDIASEQLVDVDPVQAGTQAIALQGTFPKYKMNLLRDQRRLYLSASGTFFDEGGLEAVDVDALASLGLAIAETDGQTAADLGSFAMVAPDRGLLVSSTDLAPSSHLALFALAGGVQPEELWVTVDYRAPTLVHDPQTHTLFVPDGGSANAVWIFDADTGEQLHRDPLALGGPASDLELLCDPEIECDCAVGSRGAAVPASSALGIALLSIALFVVGTAFGTRRFGSAR